ncbi:unnamed protein product [Lactuca saligna]|uniref:PCI domain-containing protein n=1 Tax=Lactuca saligna TaxID=75948 RepID=A0AA35VZM2_LACSI|nr:unnamed protein product [Lactuca saligna]
MEENSKILDITQKWLHEDQNYPSHPTHRVTIVYVSRSFIITSESYSTQTKNAGPLSILTKKLSSWNEYYEWRGIPLDSHVALRLHWELNSESVIPRGFFEWKETMDSWGSKMIFAIEVVAEMAAIGSTEVTFYLGYVTHKVHIFLLQYGVALNAMGKRVVDAPKILTVTGKIPFLSEFMNSLYECQYKSIFSTFARITEYINLDRYLHPHFRLYMREIRTVVYSQFLESYKSVTVEAMAKAFSVTVDFIDLELSLFIAVGKLHCKIDKVACVLETSRLDANNALYHILCFEFFSSSSKNRQNIANSDLPLLKGKVGYQNMPIINW